MDIETNYQQVRAQISRQNIDSDVIDEVLKRLDWVYEDIDALINSSYENWLAEYVREEAMNTRNKKEVCGCPAQRCPLKQGILPYLTTSENLNEFIASHRQPKVLLNAREEWNLKKKRVSFVLDRCHVALQREDISVLPEENDLTYK